MDGTLRGARRLSAAAAMLVATALPAAADGLFTAPTIGLDPPRIIRPVPPATAPALDANQCRLAAGTCPLGRLQRSGGRCFCISGSGAARQGSTRARPQDARPPLPEARP